MPPPSRVLVVTAVPQERDAVLRYAAPAEAEAEAMAAEGRAGTAEPRLLPGGYALHSTGTRPGAPNAPGVLDALDALAAGVGPAAAAAGTATALTAAALEGRPYGLAVSAGIGGGFPSADGGAPAAGTGVVVATAIVAADLGADTPEGFVPVTDLGFGTVEHRPPQPLVRAAAQATGAVSGPVLTVSTVTGTAARARELAARHPGAAAEAMEGFGVAEAAAAHGVPVLEIRTLSNPVGPRDRAAWRIADALDTLGGAFAALVPVLRAWTS